MTIQTILDRLFEKLGLVTASRVDAHFDGLSTWSDECNVVIGDMKRALATKVDLDTYQFDHTIIGERLAARPTNADLVVLKSDLGSRLDLIESGQLRANGPATDVDLILDPQGAGVINATGSKVTNVAAGVAGTDAVNVDQLEAAIATALPAVKTGEPTLSERLATTPQTVVAESGIVSATGLISVEGQVAKARKPKAPKGGAK